MALWQQFKSICLLQGSTEKYDEIYLKNPTEESILCLRVVFAKWIETSIGKVSPTLFLRGLQFQVHQALRHTSAKTDDTKSLRHPYHLSKYLKLLTNFSSPQEIDEFYLKFLKCISEEYKIVRLRNMDQVVAGNVFENLEVLSTPPVENGNEIYRFKNIIMNQSSNLVQWETDLRNQIGRLRLSCERFYQDNNYYVATSRESDCPTNYNLLIAISVSLLDEGTQILNMKASLERKVTEICVNVSAMIENLRMYVHHYEKLHIFSNRSGNFGDGAGIEDIGLRMDVVARSLQQIYTSMTSCQCEFDFERILRVNHDMIIRTDAHSDRASLLAPSSYVNRFNELAVNVQRQLWSLYETFTLLLDCQPPMVMMKGSRYTPISLRVFNLGNVCTDGFKIKAYLVNEHMVHEIRSKNSIPTQITSVGSIVIANRSGRNSNSNASGRVGIQQRRRRSAEEVNEMIGSRVVTLNESCSPDKKSYLIEKELIVKTIERESKKCQRQRRPARARQHAPVISSVHDKDSDNVTSEKVAILFVMELTVANLKKQVWAVSLPMIVAAHGSQNEKAWLTIAWDDALAIPRRHGFEVEETANWSQITELLKGTFEVLVHSQLKPSHLTYLKNKAKESLGSKFTDAISKQSLLENKGANISFWSWYYNTLLVIKESGHFHEAWKNGYIEGFIDYQSASDLLRNSKVQPGTFVVRFSDAKPGSLTLVFMAYNKEIYKMQPVEVHKSKSVSECAVSLLRILNVNESSQGKEVFLCVFPNICKRLAFEKFYKVQQATNQQIPKEYVQVANMIPILPSTVVKNENANLNENGNDFQTINDPTTMARNGPNNEEMQVDESNCRDIQDEAPLPMLSFDRMDTSFNTDDEYLSDLAAILSHNE